MPNTLPYQPDDLLVKFLLGEASAEEAIEASEWISKSPENEIYFHQLRQTWDTVQAPKIVAETDENEAWERFQDKLSVHAIKPPTLIKSKNPTWITRNPMLKIAAAIIFVVSTFLIGYIIYRELSPAKQIELSSTIKALDQSLPDGSEIVLNKNSSISYPSRFKENERVVSLRGEAFFRVKPDQNKPFIVRVNAFRVKVVGTSFNIRTTGGKTEVIVETGIVQIIGKGNPIELSKGEKIIIDGTGLPLQKEIQTDQLYNYYRTKSFTCENTPLWKLVEVLQEAYGVRIEIYDPANRNLLLTTTFDNESLDKILDIVAETLNLRITKADQIIILK